MAYGTAYVTLVTVELNVMPSVIAMVPVRTIHVTVVSVVTVVNGVRAVVALVTMLTVQVMEAVLLQLTKLVNVSVRRVGQEVGAMFLNVHLTVIIMEVAL